MDLTPVDNDAQPQNIGTIICVNKTGGQSLLSAVNGVAMTKESGNDGKYIVAGLQGNALTLYRSVNSFLTSNPADNIFNVIGDTIQNFPRSGAGIALITQTNGDIYIIALDTDDDEGSNNSIYLCQLTITESSVTCSDVLDSKYMPVPGLSEAVRYATNGWVITDIGTLGGDPVLATFLTTFSTGIQNINILNTSFRWGKGLAITSPDTFEIYATDRNDLTTSQFSRPVNTQKDFSLVTWFSAPASPLFLTTQGNDGIFIFDTKNTGQSPSQIPSTARYGFQNVIAIGNLLYLTTQGSDGIFTFDTQNLDQSPSQIPSTAGYGFRDVIAIGNILYLTTQGSDGIFTFDTQNTGQSPSQIPSTVGLGFQNVIIIGNLLYLTTQGSDGIFIFDTQNTSQSPSQIPSTAGYGFRDLKTFGNLLYLTTQGSDGIFTFDTQNTGQSPSQIPSTAGYGFRDMIAIDNILYLTTQGSDGIFTFDTQNTGQSPSQIPSTVELGFRGIIL
ncbi:LVIVD repeat-containing protein [Flavobacterium tiangeerense]|uniref:hypothetical protein n=1 Tax=Flavobacterium tiangeerense TaxID=459471 RepID=UPI0011A0C953|nr:hypothetical protein [Flavobacterium tiangeerense]